MDTSEQPDTVKGKNMATTQQAKDQKMFMVIIVTLLLAISAWAGYAAVLSSNGSMPHLAHATTILWTISVVNFAFAPAVYFGMRK